MSPQATTAQCAIGSALVVGLICIGGAFWAALRTQETFSKDMDFVEK